MIISGVPAVYHVMSRTALDGYVMGDVEKDFLFKLIKRMSSVYFVEVLGLCIMDNHFHLLVRMLPEDFFDDQEVLRRFSLYYGPDIKPELTEDKIESFRKKWESLSEYVKDIKQRFSRYYNKKYDRKGFFWADRFKSVIVENGDTLSNCLAYIDLNPVRAGLCSKPEDYRWNSLGYHMQTGNKENFLSMDFGLKLYENLSDRVRLDRYIQFVYEKAGLKQEQNLNEMSRRFLSRTRYFTDSAIIGTKEFVSSCFRRFRDYFTCRREKKPVPISGLIGVYSLKRLTE